MNTRHLIAMALSAVSAGVLISCAKPADAPVDSDASSQESGAANAQTSTQASTQNATTENSTASTPDAVDNLDTTPVSLTPEQTRGYLMHVSDDLVIPTYQTAADASKKLNEQAASLCQSVNDASPLSGSELAALRAQWLVLAKAWAAAEVVNFGPATASMSHLYINYFPDSRGLVHNSVSELIANNPDLTASALAQQSAIAQGIPGLEDVLYSNDSLNAGQCAYVMSASEALHTRLQDIVATWQADGQALLAVAETAEAGTASKLGLNKWLNSVLAYIETLKSEGLDKPLGLTVHAKGHLPAATAAQSRDIMAAKLSTLSLVLQDPQLVSLLQDSEANNHQNQPLIDALQTSLTANQALLADMPEDIATATPEQQQQLFDEMTTLTRLIKRQVLPVMGAQVGFNSTDGD